MKPADTVASASDVHLSLPKGIHMLARARIILLSLAAIACASTALADTVTVWNALALDAIRSANTAPPDAARHLAMLHAAIYDAVNGITGTHKPYRVTTAAPAGASMEAAALAAARAALSNLYPADRAAYDAEYNRAIAQLPEGGARTAGVTWGESAAAIILESRRDDGASNTVNYIPGSRPGEWRPTISFGGIVRPALLPHWGSVKPFVLYWGLQFRPPAAPALDTPEYAAELNLVKMLGSLRESSRTADQTEIARFWGYGPGSATPPGHWNQIAAAVAAGRNGAGPGTPNTLAENARLFALLNLALADAAIVSWDCKYTVNYWRPITAIREADTDDNPGTEADKEWLPLLETPPFPEYTSGHSTFSGAAAMVLAEFFGTDRVAFTAGSDDLPGVQRSYHSFSEAAQESGISRVYGGIHFSSANVHGLSTGAAVGMFVNWNALREIR